MALSFTTGTMTLSSWGFSAGDIAVLAGAGRAGITWLMAQYRDRSLLEFLSVEPDDILRRKGLIDTLTLHQRWDRELLLLKNGRPCQINHPSGGVVVENMDSLTWFMILVVATLDCAMSLTAIQRLIPNFLLKLLGDRMASGSEYLLREAQEHICGWRSAGCVRKIARAARLSWSYLATTGKHLPGNIPEADTGEILRLLLWISSGTESRFITASSDVVCLATVLMNLGIEMIRVGEEQIDYDENCLIVIQSSNPISHPNHFRKHGSIKRRGMRIPLNQMEECVSLWPGDSVQRNDWRTIFEAGMRAVEGVCLEPVKGNESPREAPEDIPDVYYSITVQDIEVGRVDSNAWEIIRSLLVAPIQRTVDSLISIASKWPRDALIHVRGWLADFSVNRDDDDEISHFGRDEKRILTELQIFILGYYYGLLKPLVITSGLEVPECYGSWGWNDIQVFRTIRKFILGRNLDYEVYPRCEVLRLAAYLFAGADYVDQLRTVEKRTVGILAKLSLVNASLLGDTDTPGKVGRFWLLDVDQSCIPSTASGVVFGGIQTPCTKCAPKNVPQTLQVSEAFSQVDFSSTIEPDWDYDMQKVLVAYRDQGRIVHRLNPVDIDIAVLRNWMEPSEGEERPILEDVIPVKLEEFHGGIVVQRPHISDSSTYVTDNTKIVTITKSLPKARACLAGVYGPGVATLCSNHLKIAEYRAVMIA